MNKIRGSHFYTENGREYGSGKVEGVIDEVNGQTTIRLTLYAGNSEKDCEIVMASIKGYDYKGKWFACGDTSKGDINMRCTKHNNKIALNGEWSGYGDRGYWIVEAEYEI